MTIRPTMRIPTAPKPSHLVILGLLNVAVLSGCMFGERHYRVPGNEFVNLANSNPGSIRNARFIGVAGDRAYLEVWSGAPSSAGGGIHVYSTSLGELPAAVQERLRAGDNPWGEDSRGR